MKLCNLDLMCMANPGFDRNHRNSLVSRVLAKFCISSVCSEGFSPVSKEVLGCLQVAFC